MGWEFFPAHLLHPSLVLTQQEYSASLPALGDPGLGCCGVGSALPELVRPAGPRKQSEGSLPGLLALSPHR